MARSKSRLTGSCGVSCETQLGSDLLHRLDAEVHVLFQRHAQLLRALDNVLPADAARERLVLHLFLDRHHVHLEDTAGGLDVGYGGDKSGQFVAGVEHFLECGDARHAAVVGVREDGAPRFFIDAAFGQNGLAEHGMVGRLRVDLPIEIVQQGGDAPLVFVLAQLLRVSDHAGLYRQRVFAQSCGPGEFADDIPSLFTSQHESHDSPSRARMDKAEPYPTYVAGCLLSMYSISTGPSARLRVTRRESGIHRVSPAFSSTSCVLPSGRVKRTRHPAMQTSTPARSSCAGMASPAPRVRRSTRVPSFSKSTRTWAGATRTMSRGRSSGEIMSGGKSRAGNARRSGCAASGSAPIANTRRQSEVLI